MAQRGNLIITINIEPIVKAVRKAQGDIFAALFDADEELQLIKNINGIKESDNNNK